MLRTIWVFLVSLTVATASFAFNVAQPDIPAKSKWVQRIVDADTGRSVGLFGLSLVEKLPEGYSVVRFNFTDSTVAHFNFSRNLGQGSPVSSGKMGDGNLYDFPLTNGKTWMSKSYWVNDLGESGEDDITYKVWGEESLSTSAGSFAVVRVTGVGMWKNHVTKETGSLYVVNYYAPEAMMTVRSVRTTGSSKPGVKDTKDIFELVYFKLGQP